MCSFLSFIIHRDSKKDASGYLSGVISLQVCTAKPFRTDPTFTECRKLSGHHTISNVVGFFFFFLLFLIDSLVNSQNETFMNSQWIVYFKKPCHFYISHTPQLLLLFLRKMDERSQIWQRKEWKWESVMSSDGQMERWGWSERLRGFLGGWTDGGMDG